MKKKTLCLLMTVLLCIGFLPAVVFADENYGIQINTGTSNTSITSNNASDVLNDGTVSYNADTNTLTLNNANLSYDYTGTAVIYVPNNKDLNLNLVGENTINADQCMQITGNLTIQGNGSLTANGKTYGVMVVGNITIDSATVSGNTSTSFGGIQSHQGSLLIKNGANVTGTSSGCWGIYGDKDITIDDSTVNAKSTSNENYAGMMSSSGEIVISHSTVTANSANDAGIIASNNNIIITNSTVNASTEYDNDENGIFAIGGNNVTISGGTVTATASGRYSNAIYAWEGTITISNNATVIAKASSDEAYSSLCGETGVEISSSNVTVESGGNCGIFSSGTVSIKEGSDVTAKGFYAAVRGNSDVTVSGSKLNAESTSDVAIYSPADVSINNSVVNATAPEGKKGILSQGTASTDNSWISTSGDENFEGNMTNSVLINGNSGTVNGNVKLPSSVTVPEGTTLTFPEGSSITVPNNITFTNNGTIKGNIAITNNGTIDCKNHIGGTATCDSKAICDVCGKEYGEMDATNHTNLVKTDKKDPTCKTEGNIEYWYCDGCDKYFKDATGNTEITKKETVIAKISHTADTSKWKSDENSHWRVCTECGEKLENTMTEHSFEWVIDKEATASEAGLKHEKCSVCGYEKVAVEIPAIGTTDKPNNETKPDDNKKPTITVTDTNKEPTNTDKTTSTHPQTGDNTNMMLWSALVILSGGLLTISAGIKRKRKLEK